MVAVTMSEEDARLGEQALAQVNELANFIMLEIPNEPSQDGGAVETAIRIMKEQHTVIDEYKGMLDMIQKLVEGKGRRGT